MISSIRLQDFKGHRDTTVPLGRLTVLVGPNGSGKTSVLEALCLQSQLAQHPFDWVLQGDWALADVLRRGAAGPVVMVSTGTQEGSAWSFRFTGSSGSVQLLWKRGEIETQVWAGTQEMLAAFAAIGPAALYKLNAEEIAAAAYSDQPGPAVERDGTNTAVALAALKLGYDEAFDRIERDMRRLVPNVERVRIRQATVSRMSPTQPGRTENVVGSQVFFDFRGAPGVPAHAASEGTLILLALLTILHGPNRPNLLLLDDFDQSLHPQAQIELVRLIKGLLDELPDVQIVATTHSPYILDEIDPSDVHVFALAGDGTVAVKRLSEHPEAARMKGALSAGQLWSLDPERDWVKEHVVPRAG